MKFVHHKFLLIIILTIFSLTISSFLKAKKYESSEQNYKIISETSNIYGPTSISSNGGFAKNSYTAPKGVPMKTPDMTEHLLENVPNPQPSQPESAEELITQQNYYNGDEKLNSLRIDCTIIASEFECIQQSVCGWCTSAKKCLGTSGLNGVNPCVTGQFIYGGRPNDRFSISTIQRNYGNMQKYTVMNGYLRG